MKLKLFNDNVETILSKEDNEVFYDNSNYIEFLNISPGTIKTKIEADSQISIYDIMKKWYDLQQRCIDDHERFYGYYFDDETGTTYKLTNLYISNITVSDYPDYKEVELSFNYYDKKEVWYPSDDEINVFFETYVNASDMQEDEK